MALIASCWRKNDRGEHLIYFAHISDLHFGATLANRSPSWVPMQHAHDLVKCLALPAAFDTARELLDVPLEIDDLPIVVSGDLSVSGTAQELAVAHAFVRGRFPINRIPGTTDFMGLGAASPYEVAAIPGNHDHWDGSRITLPPHNPALYEEQFRATPWRKTWNSANNGLSLELYGVDSNSGWALGEASPSERRAAGALARGRIADWQFDALEGLLKAAGPRESRTVRAFSCHHSLAYGGNTLKRAELDQSSKDRLLDLAAEYEVSAVMTGHTHDPVASHFQRGDSKGRFRSCYELRAGCAVGFKDGATDEIGFLAHRVGFIGGKLMWESQRLSWNGTRYVPFHQTPWHSFPI